GVELVRFHNAVNQSAYFCFISADKFASYKHLKRCLTQNIACQRYARCRAKETKVNSADRELCSTCRDSEIAHRYQSAARCRGHALNASDHRYWQGLDAKHHLGTLTEEPLVVLKRRLRPHLLEIVTSAERLALGRENDHSR